MRCRFVNLDSRIHGPHLGAVDAGGRREHDGHVTSAAGGRVHNGGSDGGVGQVGDHTAAAATHGIGGTLGLHHAGAAGDGTTGLELGLGDLALGEKTEDLANCGLGFLTGALDLGRQLGEATGDVTGGKNADGDALQQTLNKIMKQNEHH